MEESTSPFPEPCDQIGHLYDPNVFVQDSIPLKAALSDDASQISTREPSILVTGFGLRSIDSLQRALLEDEQRRQMLLAQHDREEEYECSSISSTSSSQQRTKASSISTQATASEKTVSHSRRTRESLSLEYLMGIAEAEVEEEGVSFKKPFSKKVLALESELEEEASKKMTIAMRKARKYLREHRIFEFFKFIIAHMLSALPENPIQFIMDLLDKCLLYRSGFGDPPLLFEKPHIEQLFFLMDRMRTGFIDKEQYETGMKTLGICSFDRNPPLSTEGLVSQEFFVEEAYECLTDLFVEMVRRHGDAVTPPSLMTPPPTEVTDVASLDDLAGEA